MMAWLWESCTVLPHQSLHLSVTEACVRTEPDITNWESCPCSPASCKTWESRPCTSPSKHNRANTDGGGMGEPAPKLWVWETCPHYLSVLSWCGIVRDFPLTPPHLLLPPTVEKDQSQHSHEMGHATQLASTAEQPGGWSWGWPKPNVMRKAALFPLFIRHVVAWAEERCPLPTSCPSISERDEGTGPGDIREGRLALPFTSCSTQKTGSCTSSGKYHYLVPC